MRDDGEQKGREDTQEERRGRHERLRETLFSCQTVGDANVEFLTDSVFQVDWNAPNVIKLRPYESRDFTVEVVNRGNLDVQLDVICTTGDDTRWLVSNCDLQNLTLPMGEMEPFGCGQKAR